MWDDVGSMLLRQLRGRVVAPFAEFLAAGAAGWGRLTLDHLTDRLSEQARLAYRDWGGGSDLTPGDPNSFHTIPLRPAGQNEAERQLTRSPNRPRLCRTRSPALEQATL